MSLSGVAGVFVTKETIHDRVGKIAAKLAVVFRLFGWHASSNSYVHVAI